MSRKRSCGFALTACLVTACLDIGDAESPSSSADSGLDSGPWPSGGKDGGGGGAGTGGSGGGSSGGGGCTTCIPAPPTGWTGPALLYLGDAPVPSCPASFPTSVATKYGGTLDAPPASCSVCSCGAPSGLGCSGASLAGYALATCQGSVTASGTAPASGACTNVGFFGQAKASHPQATGSCLTAGGAVTKATPSWTKEAHVCAGSASPGSCAAGEICAPSLAPPFGATYCVHQAGDLACPTEYASRTMVYGDAFDDTRGCTACACSALTSGGCDATVTYYDSGGCTGQSTTKPADGSCNSTTGWSIGSAKLNIQSGPSGSCTPSGGVPTGSVNGTEPMTVCCRL